ncbi:serine/threonine-protein kinase [Actinomycetospora straminea]|uniref:non-specific serine/threonine protein kinase n=1 Tax=Actinomycetospora straminea TaxID=663607 RepID=A0ABP9E1C6_9PSEU|nr:serine/threonine-protein kinase [Actinomycetospora straminea]MDD7931196.1 serine/threonine-protein kinase [Actinomycetospora straminea]
MSSPRVVAGRYRLEERIGSGAMGVVWRGTDERLGRVVAVKQVFLHAGLDDREAEEVRQRTLREGRIAARLQHPHAISVFDASIEGDEPWLVMEYLPSRSLANVLGEQGTLEPRTVARIGRQVADALDAAHQAGIVHRDVKPGNVLLGADGTVKITDFGISRATGDLTLTRTGMLAGTPAYLAPEVARGEDSTSASDVFSLGATLYAAVEGMPPFGADDNALALLHNVAAGKVVPPAQAGPLTALLMRLLRDDPAERPSAAQARQELGRIAHAGGRTEEPLADLVAPGAAAASVPEARHSSDPWLAGPAGRATGPGSGPGPVGPPTRQGLPAPDAPARRRTPRRPTAAIVVLVLLVALAAGGIVGVALLSGNGSDSTGATVASPDAANPDPAAAMVAAVRDYYGVVTGDEAAGWARLGPGLQGQTGGFARYQAFWTTIASVQVVDATAVDGDTVRATLDFVPQGRDPIREVHELGMVRGPDGRWLIDSDESVDGASPRAAATGLQLDQPLAEGPTTSASPSRAAESAGDDGDHGDDRDRGDRGGRSGDDDPGHGSDDGSDHGSDDGGDEG